MGLFLNRYEGLLQSPDDQARAVPALFIYSNQRVRKGSESKDMPAKGLDI